MPGVTKHIVAGLEVGLLWSRYCKVLLRKVLSSEEALRSSCPDTSGEQRVSVTEHSTREGS